MFLVITKYKAALAEVDVHRPKHVEFLKKLRAENKLLLVGRTNPITGAVFIFTMKSKKELKKIMSQDPYVLAGVAEADPEIVEFNPAVYADVLKEFI